MTHDQLVRCLECLGNGTRLRLLETIANSKQPLTPTYLAGVVGVRQSIASHHLVLMANEGLVVRVPSGGNVLYLCAREALEQVLGKTREVILGVTNAKAERDQVSKSEDSSVGEAGVWENGLGAYARREGTGA